MGQSPNCLRDPGKGERLEWEGKLCIQRRRVGWGRGVPHQTGPVQPIEALVVLGGIEEEEGEGDEELEHCGSHVGGDGGREADEDDEGQGLWDQVCELARKGIQARPDLGLLLLKSNPRLGPTTVLQDLPTPGGQNHFQGFCPDPVSSLPPLPAQENLLIWK